ncbi:retrovirus-related pol polyprotein from transposon TNT 1-94, partial [Tanacetum coccineum]
FLNKTLHAYFKEEGIEHQTSTPQTLEQDDAVERRNRTLVEASRTMLSASKLPLFFWAEAIATACYTHNRSIIIPTHENTAYHIINDRKPSIRHLHIFGCTCYLTKDGENLNKMKEKGDPCILHQDSRINKAQEFKTKTSANSDIQDLPLRYQVYQGRLLTSFQDDSKYEHVGLDTRSQDGKDDKDIQGKDLKISNSKTKSKNNDKGSRSKITQHEGTSLQHNKDQRFNNSMTKQSQQVQGSKIQDLTLGIRRPHIRGDC